MSAGGVPTLFRPQPAMHAWLRRWALVQGVSMSELIERYCAEGRIRDELADAAQQIEPTPGGLEQIQERIHDHPDQS